MERSWQATWNMRDLVRVCDVRTTDVVASDLLDVPGEPASSSLGFGRLEPYVARSSQFLPRVVARRSLSPSDLAPRRYGTKGETPARHVRQILWAVPGGFFQIMTTVDVDSTIPGIVRLLEDLYYDEVLDSGAIAANAADWSEWLGPDYTGRTTCPESHQLVLLPSSWRMSWEKVQRLVYRADLRAVREHSAIEFPDELNRRRGKGGALSPFVTALWGQQDYIENCAIMSAAHVVSAWARLRHVRDVAYEEFAHVQRLMHSSNKGYTTPEMRAHVRQVLVNADETISELEARLTFGVEVVASVLPVIPSLRVEAYHRSLYHALDLPAQTAIASKMLERLTAAVRSESAVLSSVEESIAELRRQRWAVSVGFLSAVAIPLTILLGFFGAGTSDVHDNKSLFDYGTYGAFYAITLAIIVMSLTLHFSMLYRGRRQLPFSRPDRAENPDLSKIEEAGANTLRS